MSETKQNTAEDAENLAEVGKYPTLEQAHEHGLVILAMREPCLIAESETPGQYSLQAEPAAAPQIASELRAYENEKEIPRPAVPDREIFRFSAGWEVYGIWMLALVACFIWQQSHPSFTDHAASSSIGLIGHGEWWRPLTALFLHADVPHLLGNLLSGLFFGTLVARTIGAWRGWALILGCGTIGNVLTSSLTWPEEFTSIGASTAVFGALGILSGLGFSAMLRARVHLPWARTVAPVLAGIVLLGWLGGGQANGNTDVLGHVFGFGSGLTAGIAVGTLSLATADASTAGNAKEERGARI
jgi:membrane associated rhomboid family serine protease